MRSTLSDLKPLRVDLDGVLAVGLELEIGAQHVPDDAHLVVGEERRRAPAPVHLAHAAVLAGERGLHPDLQAKVVQVAGGARLVARDDLVASAVEADRVAEGQVHVQRERLPDGADGPGAHRLGEGLRVVRLVEAVRRRIAGVAGAELVEALDQIEVDHGRERLGARGRGCNGCGGD
jgi:hypothetical protein